MVTKIRRELYAQLATRQLRLHRMLEPFHLKPFAIQCQREIRKLARNHDKVCVERIDWVDETVDGKPANQTVRTGRPANSDHAPEVGGATLRRQFVNLLGSHSPTL